MRKVETIKGGGVGGGRGGGKAVEMWWSRGPGAGGGGKEKNVRRREIKAELWRSTSFTARKC